MSDPLLDRESLDELLSRVAERAQRYLAQVDDLPAGGTQQRDAAAAHFVGKLPEQGDGSVATLTRLMTRGLEAATNSAGPRFFSLCYRRIDSGSAGRRLAGFDDRQQRRTLGQLAARVQARAGGDRLAERSLSAPRGLGRRSYDRRHDVQLHRAGGRPPMVG